jgi:hypothetical protein
MALGICGVCAATQMGAQINAPTASAEAQEPIGLFQGNLEHIRSFRLKTMDFHEKWLQLIDAGRPQQGSSI